MRKASCLFSILLAAILAFTSIGVVFADDAPPPVDDQTLPPPNNMEFPYGVLYTNNGINFNWDDVQGADKYILEVEYLKAMNSDWTTAIKPITLINKSGTMVPPTTATVSTKKPFPAGTYHWRITAINTDVGADPAGTGQASDWIEFRISTRIWSIGDMWPGVTTTSTAYSGKIDPKKGKGTNVNTPQLNWVVINGNSGSLEIGAQFKVTLSQGKNRWSQIVAGSTCTTSGTDKICSAPFAGFSGLASLTAGVPYTWEVLGQDQPDDKMLFPIPSNTISAVKDIVEYNYNGADPAQQKFPPLEDVKVTDTVSTNKPTFGWKQPAGSLPTKGVYQVMVEKDDNATEEIVWKPAFTANISPNVTKIPGSTQVACPTGGDCFWRFPAPFSQKFNYRWNVRIFAAGKYGPWAYPEANPMSDSATLIYHSTPNVFMVPGKPGNPLITNPSYNSVNTNSKPVFSWHEAYYTVGSIADFHEVPYYKIELKRLSPAPLTLAISAETTHTSIATLEDILPTQYDNYGLPRGVYQVVVLPIMKLDAGQAGVFPTSKTQAHKFMIAPAAPTNRSAAYDRTSKKMSVTFNKNAAYPAEGVKYRVLIKMKVGDLWRWVKIGTYAGTVCPAAGTACTLQIPAYKPGTSQALESGIYIVQIQEALKEEGNTPAKNKLWGPFGPLSSNVIVAPF